MTPPLLPGRFEGTSAALRPCGAEGGGHVVMDNFVMSVCGLLASQKQSALVKLARHRRRRLWHLLAILASPVDTGYIVSHQWRTRRLDAEGRDGRA